MIDDNTFFIDVETLPEDARPGMDLRDPPGWTPAKYVQESRSVPRNYRSDEAIERWRAAEFDRLRGAEEKHHAGQREKAEKWYREASLDPYRARIACVGWAVGESDPEVIDTVDDERLGLERLKDLLTEVMPQHIVGHNLNGFDAPMIQLRSFRNNIDGLPGVFWQNKPWDNCLQDTHEWWPTTHYRGRNRSSASLDKICALLGISRVDNPISGANVLDAYVGSRWPDVIKHCRVDIRDLREVYRRLLSMRMRL